MDHTNQPLKLTLAMGLLSVSPGQGGDAHVLVIEFPGFLYFLSCSFWILRLLIYPGCPWCAWHRWIIVPCYPSPRWINFSILPRRWVPPLTLVTMQHVLSLSSNLTLHHDISALIFTPLFPFQLREQPQEGCLSPTFLLESLGFPNLSASLINQKYSSCFKDARVISLQPLALLKEVRSKLSGGYCSWIQKKCFASQPYLLWDRGLGGLRAGAGNKVFLFLVGEIKVSLWRWLRCCRNQIRYNQGVCVVQGL